LKSHFACAKIPTPIFNSREIPFNHLPLKKDTQGRLMEMETIAFPGTKFKCIPITETLFQVETAEYPSPIPLYVDTRFLQTVEPDHPERVKELPSSNTILKFFESSVGTRYFWGGNWEAGIPELLDFYPVLKNVSAEDHDDALCRGFDCSGILYRATYGFTPRNTIDLAQFGIELHVQHLSIEQIQQKLRPLDMLVWQGHVIFVRSNIDTLIESRINQGVKISNFRDRYLEVLDLMKQQNKTLYIRRWHPDYLHQT
jgi:hypothetical protein